jgi:hypothetical protein
MTNKKLFCLLIAIITLTTSSCKSNEKPVDSILDANSLRNGSVTMYSITDKTGKIMKLIQNYILEETSEMYFIQEYSASDSEELIRVKLAPKTLNLNLSEIVTMQNTDKNETTPEQKVLASVERSGSNYFLSDLSKEKPKKTRFFYDSLVMEQEIMVYLLNCFPFESSSSASFHYINVRTQKEGTEIIRVEGKETKMFNKQEISVYKVSLSVLGGTAWYMEEKPHILVEADLPSYTIVLADWNGI